MRSRIVALLVALAALPSGAGAAEPWAEGDAVRELRELQVRVWMDRGNEPVLSRGDRARLYYHVSEDAYLAIFHIDTNGMVRLLYPGSPGETDWVRGGRDYRLLFPQSSYWYVEDDPGIGYFFALASPEPLDFSMLRYSRFEGGWDLARVGRQVYRDPYAAMDDYVAYLIPDWEYVPYALDFTSYHVGRSHDYPRFLCYDCHGFRPYSAWNPYLSACVNFRVVVYSDPYYYPVSRYRGSQVVYVRPPVPGQPRFVFKERVAGEASAPLVRPREGIALPPVERRVAPGGGGDPEGPLRRGPSSAPAAERGQVPGRAQEAPARRPSESVRPTPPSTREVPTLERRPSERSGPPAVGGTPPATREQPPAARTQPPAPRAQPPATRGQPPATRTPPPAPREQPPATRTQPPATRTQPTSASPPPARGGGEPARPPARSAPPQPTRSPSPPARSSPPPAASRSAPPPARSSPPARSAPPPSSPERPAPPQRSAPGRPGS